ncbi:terminase TerL endonuclease subunit [Mycobacterium sp. OTB74]|uniref:terminase TerL endonuclease subunit n=1 Tax=Mycobacterium sp. OTB74 TaxID=1853452 RepID=UPI002473BE81|nr:terminase TerL endonuclease subunit [Mycobacterium sp. OTB74]MDH6242533.1 phage terminase large subunit-like protein [Mycobacterium sp. OTB74]
MAGRGNASFKLADTSPPPWLRWREKDPAKRATKFIETYCRSPKGAGHGKPIRLAEFQKAWIAEILKPGIREAVLQAPRGQGKSTLLAAIAVWATFDKCPTGQPQVPIMATTVGQAVRSVYDVALKMVAAEPELADRAHIYRGVATPKIVVPFNGGEMFPISHDVDGLQGLDPSLGVCDEVGFQPWESWEALSYASGKRTTSLVVGIGTPGTDRSKSALWHLRELHRSGDVPEGFSFTELSAPDDCDYRDEANWLIANPAITEGYLDIKVLRNDVKSKPEATFRMFRLAQWVEGTDCWLGTDGRKTWRDLTSDYQHKPGADTWVGVDVGLARDTTAIVVGQWNNGVLHTTAKTIAPTESQAVDISAVLHHIRQLDKTYNLVEVAYDPKHLEMHATMLADEGIPMVEFPQSVTRMVPACGELYGAILRGEISHDGSADYERQILNGMLAYTDDGFRLTKKKSRGHIDAAIALALCHSRAQQPVKKRHPIVCIV